MRSTRSGKSFSPWDGVPTLKTPDDFNFEQLLADSFAREDSCGLSDSEDSPSLSSHGSPASSPLTSPAPSPPPSPPPKPRPAVPAHLSAAEKKKLRNKSSGHSNRKRKRSEENADSGPSNYELRPRTRRKLVEAAKQLPSMLSSEELPIAKTGYVGVRQSNSSTVYKLHDFVGPASRFRFELIEWDGRSTLLILDSAGRIIAVLVGRPSDDESWEKTHLDAAQLIEQARGSCKFSATEKRHRRGHFPALAVGISHGGGQLRPGNRVNDKVNARVLASLIAQPSFIRMAGFASGAFATWAPKLYQFYSTRLEALLAHDKSTKRPFPNSVWASATFNFGPSTVCFKHTDNANLPFGWCGITALGKFNHKKGGHLVLWDARRVLEFPAGSTVLVPSSAVAHSNVPIQRGERRYSFTQYTAGGIFRWVEQGFRTKEQHLARLSVRQRAAESLKLAGQLKRGLEMFSTLYDLKEACS